jgi:hypothetical protein
MEYTLRVEWRVPNGNETKVSDHTVDAVDVMSAGTLVLRLGGKVVAVYAAGMYVWAWEPAAEAPPSE